MEIKILDAVDVVSLVKDVGHRDSSNKVLD